jgi:hypothetical protein
MPGPGPYGNKKPNAYRPAGPSELKQRNRDIRGRLTAIYKRRLPKEIKRYKGYPFPGRDINAGKKEAMRQAWSTAAVRLANKNNWSLKETRYWQRQAPWRRRARKQANSYHYVGKK